MDGVRVLEAPTARPRRDAIRRWLRRYAPAEVAATLGAIVSAGAADGFGVPAATAYAAAIGEGLAFYGVLLIRDLRSHPRPPVQIARDLALEFGPAEVLDTLVVRPGAMLLGPLLLGGVTVGVLAGKVAADLVFYAIAIICFETGRRYAGRNTSAKAP
jgi:hypothetical protein